MLKLVIFEVTNQELTVVVVKQKALSIKALVYVIPNLDYLIPSVYSKAIAEIIIKVSFYLQTSIMPSSDSKTFRKAMFLLTDVSECTVFILSNSMGKAYVINLTDVSRTKLVSLIEGDPTICLVYQLIELDFNLVDLGSEIFTPLKELTQL